MRILILAGVAAAALTLTACDREEPAEATPGEAPTAETGAMSGDAMSADPAPAATSGDARTASDDPIPPASSMDSPVSEATREGAKEKAESTNLHPPTN